MDRLCIKLSSCDRARSVWRSHPIVHGQPEPDESDVCTGKTLRRDRVRVDLNTSSLLQYCTYVL